ncbi:hypothetical protein EYR40_001486 [Pleurotus pulmonarius]|nr:hypothetical protein EYR40_001486 [Pleurotus pulmonarius]
MFNASTGSTFPPKLSIGSWHEPCLRVVARTFAIRERHLVARRMPLPPHLRRYVRCIKLLVVLSPLPSDDIDVFLSFIRDLPHPNEFFAAFIPLTVVLSTIRAQSTITHLDLYRCSGSLMDLFRMLEASAETLSSLKLAWFSPSDPHLSKDVKTISMLALRELTVSQCSLDSMRPDWIDFPNLKVLDFSDWSGHIVFRDCLPPSLNTLAVKARPEEYVPAKPCRPLSTENFCIRWEGQGTSLKPVEEAINNMAIPSQIKHLEILLFDAANLPTKHPLLTEFESIILRFHQTGSLKKLTITQDDISKQPEKPESIASKFPQLRDLGLLDVRIGRPSVLHPPCSFRLKH